MTLTRTAKWTATARTSAPHRTKPATGRSVHRLTNTATGSTTRDALITVDALLTEARDWTILIGVSLLGWLVAAIAFGVV